MLLAFSVLYAMDCHHYNIWAVELRMRQKNNWIWQNNRPDSDLHKVGDRNLVLQTGFRFRLWEYVINLFFIFIFSFFIFHFNISFVHLYLILSFHFFCLIVIHFHSLIYLFFISFYLCSLNSIYTLILIQLKSARSY